MTTSHSKLPFRLKIARSIEKKTLSLCNKIAFILSLLILFYTLFLSQTEEGLGPLQTCAQYVEKELISFPIIGYIAAGILALFASIIVWAKRQQPKILSLYVINMSHPGVLKISPELIEHVIRESLLQSGAPEVRAIELSYDPSGIFCVECYFTTNFSEETATEIAAKEAIQKTFEEIIGFSGTVEITFFTLRS